VFNVQYSQRRATPLTLDAAVVTPYSLQALVLTDQLRISLQAIHRYDDEIAELAPKHPDYGCFSALPGAGPSWHPDCWLPSVNSASVTPARQHYRSTLVLRR